MTGWRWALPSEILTERLRANPDAHTLVREGADGEDMFVSWDVPDGVPVKDVVGSHADWRITLSKKGHRPISEPIR